MSGVITGSAAALPVGRVSVAIVELYRAGYFLLAIEKKLCIAWDSVARLLDKAWVREWKNKGR